MGPGQVQGVLDGRPAQPAAAGGERQAEVDHFPDVAVGDVREQEDHRGRGLAFDLAEPPAVGDESPRRAVALDDVIERTDSLELGHVQAGGIGRLQEGAELGLVGRLERPPPEPGGAAAPAATGAGMGILVSRSR